MEKTINLKESIYELTQKYPEIIDIMSSLGFTEISKKAVRLSVGKMVTIPRGAAMRGIAMERIVEALLDSGFRIEGAEAADNPEPSKCFFHKNHPPRTKSARSKYVREGRFLRWKVFVFFGKTQARRLFNF